MIEITAEQAIESLRKVVKGNEEKVVGCVYLSPEGKPACIVANALVECGVSVQVLYALDRSQGNAFYGQSDEYETVRVPEVLTDHGIELDDAAYAVFSIAQAIQDGNAHDLGYSGDDRSWGHALAQAEAVYADA